MHGSGETARKFRRRRGVGRAALLAFAFFGCSQDPPRFLVELSTGGEADALSRAPAPTRVEVDALDASGNARSLSRTAFSPDLRTIDLGRSTDRGTVLSVRYRARDDAGHTLLFGQSGLVELDATDQATLRLFVQRTGELARMPLALGGAIAAAEGAPLLVDAVGVRYFVVVADTRAELVDLATTSSVPFSLPRSARSVVATTNGLLVLDDAGAALFDDTGAATPVTVPAGGALSDVAGGAVVRGTSGASFVVGATRATSPSATVLRVADDGTMSFAHLTAARAGATATWIAGRGLVVLGGSADAGGAELLPDAAGANGAALAFPPLADAGLGAIALDDHRVLAVGGGAAPRVFDVACTTGCAPAPFFTGNAATAPMPALAAPDLARLADGSVFALGKGADGKMRALRMQDATGAADVPLRVPRTRARLAHGVGGALLVVGGAPEVESFVIDP